MEKKIRGASVATALTMFTVQTLLPVSRRNPRKALARQQTATLKFSWYCRKKRMLSQADGERPVTRGTLPIQLTQQGGSVVKHPVRRLRPTIDCEL